MTISKHGQDWTITLRHIAGTFYGQVEIETPTEYGVRWDSGTFTYVLKNRVS